MRVPCLQARQEVALVGYFSWPAHMVHWGLFERVNNTWKHIHTLSVMLQCVSGCLICPVLALGEVFLALDMQEQIRVARLASDLALGVMQDSMMRHLLLGSFHSSVMSLFQEFLAGAKLDLSDLYPLSRCLYSHLLSCKGAVRAQLPRMYTAAPITAAPTAEVARMVTTSTTRGTDSECDHRHEHASAHDTVWTKYGFHKHMQSTQYVCKRNREATP
jgi:hypothetical protein